MIIFLEACIQRLRRPVCSRTVLGQKVIGSLTLITRATSNDQLHGKLNTPTRNLNAPSRSSK